MRPQSGTPRIDRRRGPSGLLGGVTLIAAIACMPGAAHADFFDGARKTFTQDIPHFFQDDIPCAFGGQPTSHTKTSCRPGPSNQQAQRPLSREPSSQPLPASPQPVQAQPQQPAPPQPKPVPQPYRY